MTVVCSHCSATKFEDETSGLCCKNGKVQLPTLQTPPEPLKHLLLRETPESRHFLDNIRKYNSCFQMTSFGTAKEVSEPGYMPTFKIQGQVYHTVGSLFLHQMSNRSSCRSTSWVMMQKNTTPIQHYPRSQILYCFMSATTAGLICL